MTIKTALKNYDKNLSLKVGAKDGTAFFYVGTVGDFLENMDVYDSVMRNRTLRIQIRAERAFENEIKNAPTRLKPSLRSASGKKIRCFLATSAQASKTGSCA